jgi:hypothetical protein
MMISEIAEFVGIDNHRTVWSAIRNEDNDNLEEDGVYLNGDIGEIVNVDALGDIRPIVIKREDGVEERTQLWPEESAEHEASYSSEDEIESRCKCMPHNPQSD